MPRASSASTYGSVTSSPKLTNRRNRMQTCRGASATRTSGLRRSVTVQPLLRTSQWTNAPTASGRQASISRGETKTGLTIFRPTDGLDEGAVILQKETPVSENDTLGTVYFDRLFPMGVQAMLEAADLVVGGKHKEVVQDETQATYEGWFRANEAKVHWHNHVDFIHDLIRAADPAPGAWTTLNGKKVQLFGSKKHPVRTFGAVKGKVGEVTEITEAGMRVTAQGGQVEIAKVKGEETKKISAAEWAKGAGVAVGTILGS